jgi:ketosteroid isomerase-like protein
LLEGAIERWVSAVNSQDENVLSRSVTDDVELLDSNVATVKGRDATMRTLREVGARGRLVATTREITMVDDVAWHVVTFSQIQKNGDVHARGQALEIWKRVNGRWQLHRQMSAGFLKPTNALTRPSTDQPVLDRPKD